MADIVQLQENGVAKFMKTHINAVEGIEEIRETTILKPTYNTGFTDYSGPQSITIKKVGKVVFISGACTNTGKLAKGASFVPFVLPKNMRPSSPVSVVQQGSGFNVFQIWIDAAGTVQCSRYRNGSTDAEIGVGSWLNISATYLTEG